MIKLSQIARTPALLASKLFKLEQQGRFAAALQDYLEVINGKVILPGFAKTTRSEKAELLLRYGALVGYVGQTSQIANSQEQSKDLLTSAFAEFARLGETLKLAECENYIALAYWRLGELNEASIWINSSFARSCPKRSYPRLQAYVVASLINIERCKFDENIALLRTVENDFLAFADDHLLGMYYSNLGISFKDLGITDTALTCFERALRYYDRSKHRIYYATVENNLALLYKDRGLFEKAHQAVDSATKIYLSAKDKTRAGSSLDTKANILLSEGSFPVALHTIERAIDILKRGENATYYTEALTTRARILLHLDRFGDAMFSIMKACEIRNRKVGEAHSRDLIAIFEREVAAVYSAPVAARAAVGGVTSDSGIHLLLPKSLGNFRSYTAIRIHNSFLERFGLVKGKLAVIADEPVNRGDIVAIEVLSDRSVHCGLFDRDFGLVCLDRGDDQEPELFNESEIRILGKIIGFGEEVSSNSGPVVVQPISL